MQYVNLGRSNLKVSRLGFGAMGIGDQSWRSWVLNEEAAGPILKRALELGINFIDTCDYYSLGRSEEVIGRLLRSLARREEIVLATKVGNPMGQGANARGFSRKHLNEAVNQSLRRLQTDYIDLYQTHIWDPSTHIEEMVDALDALVRAGKVLYLGITDMPAWQLAKAYYHACYTGRSRFISVQNHYNAIWREDERELLPFCRAEGLGVISYSPMARGFLAGRARRDGSRPTERLRSDDYAHKIYGRPNDRIVAEAVEKVAAARGLAPAQVALAWTLSRPGMTAPIFGATRLEHVDAAAAALAITLDADALRTISEAYEPRAGAA
jgi:aryl-alcohol dehydrogenase-like predicted oxidoreductase